MLPTAVLRRTHIRLLQPTQKSSRKRNCHLNTIITPLEIQIAAYIAIIVPTNRGNSKTATTMSNLSHKVS